MSIPKKNNKNPGIQTAGGTSPPPTGIPTRQSKKSMLTQEDIEVIASTVMNIENAEDYLNKNLLCHSDQPFSITHIISVLFHITQLKAIPLPAIEAIRAVTFILKKHEANEIAELVAESITDNLAPKIVDHIIAARAPQVARIFTTSENLDNTLKEAERIRHSIEREKEEKEGETETAAERIEEAANTLHESIEECKNSLKLLLPSIDKTNEHLTEVSQQIASALKSTPPEPQQPRSYSTAVASNLAPSIDQALARAAIRAHQIILDPLPGGNMFPPDTTHEEIVKTLKEALGNIKDETTPPGDIKAVTSFRNGGLLVELESGSLATWLRKPFNRTALTNKQTRTNSFLPQ
jgi:hypothetical protein